MRVIYLQLLEQELTCGPGVMAANPAGKEKDGEEVLRAALAGGALDS